MEVVETRYFASRNGVRPVTGKPRSSGSETQNIASLPNGILLKREYFSIFKRLLRKLS